MVKVSVHSCLPNGHLNLCSNFNSNKLVKSETSSCDFAMVGLKWGENSSKHRKSFPAWLSIKWASKSMTKFKFHEIGQK